MNRETAPAIAIIESLRLLAHANGNASLNIHRKATDENTVLEDGYFWVKIVNKKTPDTAARLLDVRPQAIRATFFNQKNDLTHLQTALPVGTISKFKVRKGGVKIVEQPYHSFGGRPEEKNVDFYLRVSERLRAHGRVRVSSESPLPAHLDAHRYRGDPGEIHHVMAFCRAVIGESATMASEAAVLGVPAVYEAFGSN